MGLRKDIIRAEFNTSNKNIMIFEMIILSLIGGILLKSFVWGLVIMVSFSLGIFIFPLLGVIFTIIFSLIWGVFVGGIFWLINPFIGILMGLIMFGIGIILHNSSMEFWDDIMG